MKIREVKEEGGNVVEEGERGREGEKEGVDEVREIRKKKRKKKQGEVLNEENGNNQEY